MKLRYTNNQPINWREDSDGMLRITMCILKEGVYNYGVEEVPDGDKITNAPEIRQYIPAEEFSKPEALASLEGKPLVILEHEWRDADNTLTDGYTVGTIAGTPHVEGDELLVDGLIFDAETREKIKSGELIEVSAAYDGSIAIGEGTYGNKVFDATQNAFRFNHVLLLPQGAGRCGRDVRIINHKPIGEKMSLEKTASLKVRIGNADRTFRFVNEEDRAEAEAMLEEQKQFNAEEVQAAIEGKSELEAQIAALQEQLAAHDANLNAAKEEIERLLSPEVQEELADEALEQREDEDEVISDEVATALEGEEIENSEEAEKEETEKIENSVRKGSFANRRKNIVEMVFANRKQKLPASWNQDAIDGAFESMVLAAKMNNAARKEAKDNPSNGRVLNGKQTPGTPGRTMNSNRERMLRPMKANNKEPNNG